MKKAKTGIFIVIFSALVITMSGCSAFVDGVEDGSSSRPTNKQSGSSATTAESNEPFFVDPGTTAATVAPTKDNSETIGQRNAVRKAKEYLEIIAFSREGLIKQLKFDGYTQDQAAYGADHCGADWNEQAALKAKDYLELIAFSREGLIEQLKYDGYTQEQAVYGVEANGY